MGGRARKHTEMCASHAVEIRMSSFDSAPFTTQNGRFKLEASLEIVQECFVRVLGFIQPQRARWHGDSFVAFDEPVVTFDIYS